MTILVRGRVMMRMTVTVTEMMMMVRVTVHIMKQQNTVSILRYRLSACVCAGAVMFSSNKWTKSALISDSNSKYYVSPSPALFYPLISSHLISSHLISSHLISSPFLSLLSFFSPLSSSLPPSYHLCSSSHLISSHLISSHLISSHLISFVSSHHITLFPPLLLYAVSNFFSSADIFELKLLAAFSQPIMITPRMPPR